VKHRASAVHGDERTTEDDDLNEVKSQGQAPSHHEIRRVSDDVVHALCILVGMFFVGVSQAFAENVIHRDALMLKYAIAQMAHGETKIEVHLVDEQRLIETEALEYVGPDQIATGDDANAFDK
jgi:hypothetical protein